VRQFLIGFVSHHGSFSGFHFFTLDRFSNPLPYLPQMSDSAPFGVHLVSLIRLAVGFIVSFVLLANDEILFWIWILLSTFWFV